MESSLSGLKPSEFKNVWDNLCAQWALKSAGALFLTLMEFVFGTTPHFLGVVLGLIVLDTCTGVWKAAKQGNVSSRGFFKFSAKILVYWIMLAAAALVDKSLPFKFALPIMISFLSLTEMISILENVAILGWPVPTKLVKTLRDYNDKTGGITAKPRKKSVSRKKKR